MDWRVTTGVLLRRERGGLGLLLAAWLAFFWRILLGRAVYFLDDLKIIYYPLEVAYAQAQAGFSLPLWSTLFGFGQPLLAWGQLGFLTPVHVVLRALQVPPLEVLQVSVVAYFGLGLLGMYVFLRRCGLWQAAAALGATVFVFSGFSIGHLNHVNFYTATMVLPWLLVVVASFVARPTFLKTAGMALLVAAMALGAQPQVVVYAAGVAAVFGLVLAVEALIKRLKQRDPQRLLYFGQLVFGVALAAVTAFCLSSLTILPLFEFLPLTERGGDLPTDVLFEFSYPPSHAITLLLPYFFGNHEVYWGAKGFQELAAFTGVLPLLLAGGALTCWRHWRALRISGVLLTLLGIIVALGIHSPIYRWLVEQHIVTTLAIPGRFVFFFDVGVALLAAAGLDDLRRLLSDRRRLIRFGAVGLAVVAGLLAPFVIALPTWPQAVTQAGQLLYAPDATLLLAILAVAVWLLLLTRRRWNAARLGWSVAALAIGTLVIAGYSYNPVLPRSAVFEPPFAEELQAWGHEHGVPARLYSRDQLLADTSFARMLPTSTFSPVFTLHQPITSLSPETPCLQLPLFVEPGSRGQITVSISTTLTDPPLESTIITASDIGQQSTQQVCFERAAATGDALVLTITSDTDSGINAYYYGLPGELEAYFVRVANPTDEELVVSQKQARLAYEAVVPASVDTDLLLLPRHLQAAYGVSGGRWIGALSVQPYRDFIELFLANDQENIVDGDGVHRLVKHRAMLDVSGITHLAHSVEREVTDVMSDFDYTLVDEATVGNLQARLYENPTAFPKVFAVPHGIWKPAADEARAGMLEDAFNPGQVAYISGPMPPPDDDPTLVAELADVPATAQRLPAELVSYERREVVARVSLEQPAWVIVNDTTTPQWQTFIDGESAPYYVADTLFKAALVPAGEHTVAWRYHSPAVERAVRLTWIGLALTAGLLAVPGIRRFRRTPRSTSADPR